jgi:uncharacterized protein
MTLAHTEVLETLRMLQVENLDIRTTTLGVNLLDCAGGSVHDVARRIHEKLVGVAGNLVATAKGVEAEFGIPIVNKRIAVTPIALVAPFCTSAVKPPMKSMPQSSAARSIATAIGV